MCNPRRVQVTATEQVNEAWEREVRRVASVSGGLTGEARIVQPLDASVGAAALMFVRRALQQGFPGWTAQEDGTYRHEVAGGYALFDAEDNTLTIVAALSEELSAEGRAEARLGGTYTGTVKAEAEAHYYDDNWGGRTREMAEAEARRTLDTTLVEQRRAALDQAADAAEQARDADLRAEAEADARRSWERQADTRRQELRRQAERDLGDIGLMARRAFHQLLTHGYREALLALARRRGVRPDDIHVEETADSIEIDFLLPD